MEEILRPFLMQTNIIDVIIKKIGGLIMLTTTLGDIKMALCLLKRGKWWYNSIVDR